MALQLWLPLNGDTKNYGLKNIDVLDYGTSEYNKGKIGKCRSFVGNGYLKLVNSFGIEPYKDFSCCYWIKEISNNTLSGFRVVYQCGDLIIGHYNDKINIYNAKDLDFVYKCDITDWVHCCLTYQSSSNIMTIYINGIKCSTRQPKSLNNLSSTTALIGKRNNESYLLEGYLNDFRLYDECLSPKQIKYISQAMICHYPMGNIDGKIGGRNLLRNSSMNGERLKCDRSQSCNSTTTLAYSNDGFHIVTPSEGNNNNGIVFIYDDFTRLGINIGDTITFSLLVKGSSDSNKPFINIIFQNDGTTWYDKGTIRSLGIEFTPTDVFQKIYVTYTLPTDKKYSSKTMFLGIHGNMKSDLYIKNLKLEKSSTSTPYTHAPEDNSQFYDNIIPDISGYQNNATVKDSTCPTWSDDSPRYLGSYEFNGENQYISGLSPVSSNTKEFTISFWTKLNNTSGVMTFYTARKGIGSGVALFFVNKNIRFDDNAQFAFNYTCDLSSNKWTHLCVTRNNTSKKLYINGKLVDSTSKVGDMQNIGQHFTIGGSESSDSGIADMNWLNGNISDFRIYTTALSESDVLDLYQSSASLDSQGNLMLTGEVIE